MALDCCFPTQMLTAGWDLFGGGISMCELRELLRHFVVRDERSLVRDLRDLLERFESLVVVLEILRLLRNVPIPHPSVDKIYHHRCFQRY
jgi:hypothetical protein